MWWNYLGGLVEGVGLIVTAYGLHDTWRRLGTGEPLWQPIRDRTRRAWRKTYSRLRRLLRRPPLQPTHQVTSTRDTAWALDAAHVTVTWEPLDPELAAALALQVLDARIRELQRTTNEEAMLTRARMFEMEGVGRRATSEIAGVRADLDTAKRQLPVEGLRTEASGLALVGLGLLIQLVGNAVSVLVG